MWYFKMWLKSQVKLEKTSTKFISVFIIFAVMRSALATRPGCSEALGMQDKRITDRQLTSYSSDTGYYASYARIKHSRAWCSDSEKAWTEYLQIRLDKVRHISAIDTQGYQSLFVSYWVNHFSLQYSYDGRSWYWYKDGPSGAITDFYANTDATTIKRITLRDTFVAKYLRIYPTAFKDDMCMRLELYGCPENKDCTTFMTAPSGVVSSPNYPFKYPAGIDCTWIISIASKHVTVFFKYFDINNGTSKDCQGDYVEVMNGKRDVSPSLGRVCNGVDIPVFKSTGDVLRLHFHSEWHSAARKGFLAAYNSGNVIKATACSGSTLKLNCLPSSKSIKIIHASYGVMPFSSSCDTNTSTSSPCQASGIQEILTSKCDYYQICNVPVNSVPLFPLWCGAGRVPQLQVYYQCTGTVIKTLPPTTIAPSTTTTTTPRPTTNQPSSPTTAGTTTLKPTTEPFVPIKTISHPSTTPTVAATEPGDVGGKLASVKEKDKTGMVVGIVVAVLLIIVVVVILLVCFLYRRRKKQNEKPTAGVTYTAPRNSLNITTSAPRSGSRTNPYETVNVLYVSADDMANDKDQEQEHIYDSPSLQGPLPKMTNNPLYHAFDSIQPSGYENLDNAKPPPSLDPAIYDQPLQSNKSTTSTSISNPNYGKSIEIIPDK